MIGCLYECTYTSSDEGDNEEQFECEWLGKNLVVVSNEYSPENDINLVGVLLDGELWELMCYEPGVDEFWYSTPEGDTKWERVGGGV